MCLRQKKRKFVSSDPKGKIRCAQCGSQSGGCHLQNIVASQMAVSIIYFLQLAQVENYNCQLLIVALCANQFLVQIFVEEPPVIQARQRIGGGIDLQPFQIVVFNQHGNAQQAFGGKYVEQGSFQGNCLAEAASELFAALENSRPVFAALRFRQFEARERPEQLPKELSTRGIIKTVEGLDQ